MTEEQITQAWDKFTNEKKHIKTVSKELGLDVFELKTELINRHGTKAFIEALSNFIRN